MPKIDQRRELLRLIARSPCGTENAMYLGSEGIKPQTIGAAVRLGLVSKVNSISYALTAAGRAALTPEARNV